MAARLRGRPRPLNSAAWRGSYEPTRRSGAGEHESDEFYARSGDGGRVRNVRREAMAGGGGGGAEATRCRRTGIARTSSCPLDEAVATMDETRDKRSPSWPTSRSGPEAGRRSADGRRMLHREE